MTTKSKEYPYGKRGFAGMSAEKRKAIATLGGKAVPADKRSFSQDRDLASSAGSAGGKASGAVRRKAA